ncbi:YraN family protein [Paenibacillus validus]|uniref:UPF0102 protein GNP93_07615 n=1 Tax=Paenibacillus validus TaxID=44253 RepID=A0A7X2Z8Z9_9BACL|nr:MULTISPECIES: YraN family protein [Paenibacillus]MED4599557.1 YraN family protein [Paenibacillus validus]MED4607091.1 YraN family protein [Paenibacillus validus]MUG70548.1 YraN family protein [Paenibacillus validus]
MTDRLANRKQRGAKSEAEAAAYLNREGWTIVARNWRCRTGELDIVAEEKGTLVIVEVRSRNLNETYGTPSESVNGRKQRQIRETAEVYLHRYRVYDRQVRFDVVAIRMDREDNVIQLEHIRNAF